MLRFLILLAVLILGLSYFGISIRHIVESPTGTDNFDFVWHLVEDGWQTLIMWLTSLTESVKHVVS